MGALERELKTFPETCEYDLLLKRHTELHGPLFHSASLELNTANRDVRSSEELPLEAYEGEAPVSLVRKMWAYGRYLFISGTAPNRGRSDCTACGAETTGLYGATIWRMRIFK